MSVTVLDYRNRNGNGWSVARDTETGSYTFIETLGKKITRKKAELVAKLEYSVNNDVILGDSVLISLFESDICGEQVTDDKLEYLWFKFID